MHLIEANIFEKITLQDLVASININDLEAIDHAQMPLL
jgi:hypothetical protein